MNTFDPGALLRRVVLATLVAVALLAVLATKSHAAECHRTVSPLVTALANIDADLDDGLTFGQYGQMITVAKRKYNRIPVEQLDWDCLSDVAVPAENALQAYIRGYNTWRKSIVQGRSRTAKENRLIQKLWAQAERAVTKAVNNLE